MRIVTYQDEIIEKAHDNDILLSLMMELNTSCNERCEHCYIPNHDNTGLETELIKKVIREFRNLGGLNLSLTGGEIFLRKDIFEIIEYARNMHLRVFLLTNGTLITKEIAHKLKKVNIAELSVSVYSLIPDVHDSITQRKGSLFKTLAGLKYAKDEKIRVMVKTPLMEKNKHAYKDLKKFCDENGFGYLASAIIFSKSDGDDSVKDLSINRAELPLISKEVEKLEPVGKRNQFEEACGSLKYSLAIDANGDVYPCNSFYYKVGNVKIDSLEVIWSSDKLSAVKNIKRADLVTCNACELQNKCKRCPGLAYLEDGDYYGCSSTAKLNACMRA